MMPIEDLPVQDLAVTTLKIVIFSALAIFVAIFIGLVYKGIDRKLAAHMQWRIGPPIRQPFLDVAKLFMKESIVPENAVPWVFHAAPIVCLATAVLPLLYMPLCKYYDMGSFGDLILILYLLILPSLAMVVGGFASASPFATVGAQREMVLMLSLEFPLAAIIVGIAWRLSYVTSSNVFSISTVVAHPLWNLVGPLGFIGLVLMLFALVLAIPGEVSKIPFDIAEAETEIAGGLLVEYSGRNLAMFYLADAVKAFVLGSLVVLLFFPYNLSPYLVEYTAFAWPEYALYAIDGLFFLLKVFVVLFASITLLRVSVARLKVDQVSHLYWVMLTGVVIAGILLMWLDMLIGGV